MGLWGAITGGAIGLVTGGPAGAVIGAVAGYGAEEVVGNAVGHGGGSSTTVMPPSVDYSAAMLAASDNSKTTALAQINAQMMALQQGSIDRELQMAANLELGLERLDTKLQAAKLDFFQSMTREENLHTERIAARSASSADLPPPEVEEEKPGSSEV